MTKPQMPHATALIVRANETDYTGSAELDGINSANGRVARVRRAAPD